MRPRKITRKMIIDSTLYAGSVERTIEMIVDDICNHNVEINLQFWRDVNLYGLSEAIDYLHQNCPLVASNRKEYDKLYTILAELKGDTIETI